MRSCPRHSLDIKRCGQRSTYRSCYCELISVREEKRAWNMSQCQIMRANRERMILTLQTMSCTEAGFTENSQGKQRDHSPILSPSHVFGCKRIILHLCISEWTNCFPTKKKKKKVLICSLFIKNLLLSYAKICHILSQKLGSSLWSVPLNILPIVKLFEQQWNRELVANTAAFNYTLNENQR